MGKWDTFAICAVILLAPELLKKLFVMKYGGSQR